MPLMQSLERFLIVSMRNGAQQLVSEINPFTSGVNIDLKKM